MADFHGEQRRQRRLPAANSATCNSASRPQTPRVEDPVRGALRGGGHRQRVRPRLTACAAAAAAAATEARTRPTSGTSSRPSPSTSSVSADCSRPEGHLLGPTAHRLPEFPGPAQHPPAEVLEKQPWLTPLIPRSPTELKLSSAALLRGEAVRRTTWTYVAHVPTAAKRARAHARWSRDASLVCPGGAAAQPSTRFSATPHFPQRPAFTFTSSFDHIVITGSRTLPVLHTHHQGGGPARASAVPCPSPRPWPPSARSASPPHRHTPPSTPRR
ncbi:hypothetical protein SHIRM173S_09236 [Streptomyces hirsutus]